MKTYTYIFMVTALLCGTAHAASSCSHANLTRCLDSVCAINGSMNAAARCQYCGDAGAGAPPSGTAQKLKSLSTGTSSKYTISAKELESAPTDDPSSRMFWAAEKCLAKVSGCTSDDITEVYIPLIEQSCRAAGIKADMSESIANSDKPKDENVCRSSIAKCMQSDNHCASYYSSCTDDSIFNEHFSVCVSLNNGCDEHLATIRTNLISARDNAIKTAANYLKGVVTGLQQERQAKINQAQSDCKNDQGFENCVKNVCEENMRDKCNGQTTSGNNTANAELSVARELCQFYKTACDALRIDEKAAKGAKK